MSVDITLSKAEEGKRLYEFQLYVWDEARSAMIDIFRGVAEADENSVLDKYDSYDDVFAAAVRRYG